MYFGINAFIHSRYSTHKSTIFYNHRQILHVSARNFAQMFGLPIVLHPLLLSPNCKMGVRVTNTFFCAIGGRGKSMRLS